MKPDLGRLGQVLDPPEREGDDGENRWKRIPIGDRRVNSDTLL